MNRGDLYNLISKYSPMWTILSSQARTLTAPDNIQAWLQRLHFLLSLCSFLSAAKLIQANRAPIFPEGLSFLPASHSSPCYEPSLPVELIHHLNRYCLHCHLTPHAPEPGWKNLIFKDQLLHSRNRCFTHTWDELKLQSITLRSSLDSKTSPH